MPSHNLVPPTMQKGTSEPTFSPISQSFSSDKSALYNLLRAKIVPEASALPPPSPDCEGMFFSMLILTPPTIFVSSKNNFAALKARFCSPQGSVSSEHITEMSFAFSRAIISYKETDYITVFKR